ncbi:globin [Micromonospora sp. NBC_01412]|uniref:globin n=1 Tax=Micromonospora sp. NBC_01412 TaxID=2903590 RepID=UPI003253D364
MAYSDEVVREAVWQWLRLVAADAELEPYLVGVDLGRFADHLAATLGAALDGRAAADAWPGLGLGEEQHRRLVDYLAGVLWALDVPQAAIAAARAAFAGEARPTGTAGEARPARAVGEAHPTGAGR